MAAPGHEESLHIERAMVAGHVVLAVSGRMHASNALQFEEACQRCMIEGHTDLVADLGGLTYISSMGLRSFLSVTKTLQGQGGTLQLCCLKGLVKQVFEITGMAQVLQIRESVESAVSRG